MRKNLQHWEFGLYAQPKSNCGSSSARYPSYIASQTYKIGAGDCEITGNSKLVPLISLPLCHLQPQRTSHDYTADIISQL